MPPDMAVKIVLSRAARPDAGPKASARVALNQGLRGVQFDHLPHRGPLSRHRSGEELDGLGAEAGTKAVLFSGTDTGSPLSLFPLIMIKCPRTGQPVFTGVETDRTSPSACLIAEDICAAHLREAARVGQAGRSIFGGVRVGITTRRASLIWRRHPFVTRPNLRRRGRSLRATQPGD